MHLTSRADHIGMLGSVIDDNSIQFGQNSLFGSRVAGFGPRPYKHQLTTDIPTDKEALTLTLFGFPADQWDAVRNVIQRVTGPIDDVVVSWSHVRVTFPSPEAVRLCRDFNGAVINDNIIGVSSQKPQLRSDADYLRGASSMNRDSDSNASRVNMSSAISGLNPEAAAAALKLSAQLGTPLEQTEENSSIASSFLKLLFDI